MANVVPIIFNNATIQAAYSGAINAAFTQLYKESGIKPRVLSAEEASDGIAGGSRKINASNPATGVRSDHYEANTQGAAAVDIDNQRTFRNWNEDRFIQIMAAHGFRNMDIIGFDFPEEPWHFASHSPITPAFIPTTESDTDMQFLSNNTIAWSNGFVNSYRADVYEACRQVVQDGVRGGSKEATFIREQWAATNWLIDATAKAAAKLIK